MQTTELMTVRMAVFNPGWCLRRALLTPAARPCLREQHLYFQCIKRGNANGAVCTGMLHTRSPADLGKAARLGQEIEQW